MLRFLLYVLVLDHVRIMSYNVHNTVRNSLSIVAVIAIVVGIDATHMISRGLVLHTLLLVQVVHGVGSSQREIIITFIGQHSSLHQGLIQHNYYIPLLFH